MPSQAAPVELRTQRLLLSALTEGHEGLLLAGQRPTPSQPGRPLQNAQRPPRYEGLPCIIEPPFSGRDRSAVVDPFRSSGLLRTGQSMGWKLTLNAHVKSVGRANAAVGLTWARFRPEVFDGVDRVPQSALQRWAMDPARGPHACSRAGQNRA